MDEIRPWKVSGTKDAPTITDVSSVDQTHTEEMLEEILVKSPTLLGNGLRLVGRQTETPGGALDLLGVDEDGRLVVFELKRGTLTRDAVAQIIDYGSFLAELSFADLSSLVSEGLWKNGIDKISDFAEWYQNQFWKNIDTIGKPMMVLVGLGVDERARRMVEFISSGEIETSLITFHGFSDGTEVFLARQVEVAQKQSVQSAKNSKGANLQTLLRKIKTSGVEYYFNEAAAVIRAELPSPYEWPNQTWFTYYLRGRSRSVSGA